MDSSQHTLVLDGTQGENDMPYAHTIPHDQTVDVCEPGRLKVGAREEVA